MAVYVDCNTKSQIILPVNTEKFFHPVKYSVQLFKSSTLLVEGSECFPFSDNLALMDTELEALWIPETILVLWRREKFRPNQ
jgi:hypothetical protein